MRRTRRVQGFLIVAGGLLTLGRALAEEATPLLDPELEREFKSQCERLLEDPILGTHVFAGKEGWLLGNAELSHASTGVFWGDQASVANSTCDPKHADPLPVVLDFHEQLASLGIELILLPVPMKPVIYPESVLGGGNLPRPLPLLQPVDRQFLGVLRESGVESVDLTTLFLDHRDDDRDRLYLPSDSHWTPYGAVLAAQSIAARLREGSWYGEAPRVDYTATWRERTHRGWIYKTMDKRSGEPELPGNPTVAREVSQNGDAPGTKITRSQPGSPVLLIGDSHTTFYQGSRSDLAHQLAYELGFPVDVISANGDGANAARLELMRRLKKDPGALDGTKAVIWCFSSSNLSGAPKGWHKVQLVQNRARPNP